MSQGLVMVHYNESFHYSRLTACNWQWQVTSDSDNWQWEWSKWLNDDNNDHKFTNGLTDWLTDWLTDCPDNWLQLTMTDTDWLFDCLTVWLTDLTVSVSDWCIQKTSFAFIASCLASSSVSVLPTPIAFKSASSPCIRFFFAAMVSPMCTNGFLAGLTLALALASALVSDLALALAFPLALAFATGFSTSLGAESDASFFFLAFFFGWGDLSLFFFFLFRFACPDSDSLSSAHKSSSSSLMSGMSILSNKQQEIPLSLFLIICFQDRTEWFNKLLIKIRLQNCNDSPIWK